MVSVMLYPCIICVALLKDLFFLGVACLTVFVNYLVKQSAIWLGVVVVLLWKGLVWIEVLCSIDRVGSSRECACCASDTSVHLSVSYIGFCMSEVISSFKSLTARSQVFALPMLVLCVNLHTKWSSKSLQLLCILPLGMLYLSAITMM